MRKAALVAIVLTAACQTPGLAQPLGPHQSRLDIYEGTKRGPGVTCVGTCYGDRDRTDITRMWECTGDWAAASCPFYCDKGEPVGSCPNEKNEPKPK
jgi:hypothetical protein